MVQSFLVSLESPIFLNTVVQMQLNSLLKLTQSTEALCCIWLWGKQQTRMSLPSTNWEPYFIYAYKFIVWKDIQTHNYRGATIENTSTALWVSERLYIWHKAALVLHTDNQLSQTKYLKSKHVIAYEQFWPWSNLHLCCKPMSNILLPASPCCFAI